MHEPRRGRVHDAEGAREAILDAAEAAFAEHGFDGARIGDIAKASSYNSSLLFHYFQDKLSLYAEVVKRADREMTELQARVLAPLLQDGTAASTPRAFKALLEEVAGTYFDYLVAHPRFVRILLWEQAEGWQTFAQIFSQFDTDYSDQFETLFRSARSNGLLRSDYAPLVQLSMVLQICMSYLTFLPLYQIALLPGADLHADAAIARAKEYVTGYIVHGMMVDFE